VINVTKEEHKIAADEALADYNAADGDNETEAQALARFRDKAMVWFEAGREMRLLPFEAGAIDIETFWRIGDALLGARSFADIAAAFE
jgi:hypothetical protein